MNTILTLLIFISYFIDINTQPSNTNNQQNVSIIGNIRLPEQITPGSCLYICYNGEVIKIKENETSFIIKDNNNDKINILFTPAEDIIFCSEDNTILCLRLSNKKRSKLFKLTKKILDEDKKTSHLCAWDIKEYCLKNKNKKFEIPSNTLIVPLNPFEIQIILENVTWKKDSNLMKLPIIDIRSIKNKENIDDQFLKSCLAIRQLKPFHSSQENRKKTIQHGPTTISLIVD